MSKNLKMTITTLVVVIAFSAAAFLRPGYAQAPTPQPEPLASTNLRTISVSGMGQVAAQPDTAVVVVGVETQAETASEAITQNNEQMTELISALQGAGVPEANIQTQSLTLYPRYSEQPPGPPDDPGQPTQPEVIGYVASNTVQVRLEEIDQVGDILDAAVQAGANVIYNIRFEVSDRDEQLQQAREEAMNDARQKAEQLAELAGAELGEIWSINEGGGGGPIPFGMGGAAQDAAVPIEPGSQDVTVQVQVTWQLTSGQ